MTSENKSTNNIIQNYTDNPSLNIFEPQPISLCSYSLDSTLTDNDRLEQQHAANNDFSNNSIARETFSILNFNDSLAGWAVNHNVSNNTVNSLLKLLKTHKCFSSLPKDSRTLLKTFSSSEYSLRTVEPGLYYHFGIAKGILQNYEFNEINTSIKIAVGIDGLPLSKSSGSQFWPILGYIINKNKKPKVFPIGVYHGYKKPNDSDDYLLDFVNEAVNLSNNGLLMVNNKKINIIFEVFCCDIPAKSFVLKTKGHSGFSSCARCKIEGDYINNRVCFPYSNHKSALRTDLDYRNCIDEDFHTSITPSILTRIPNLDITNSFVLDYMHLINLGVMRKLISFWIIKGPSNVRLPGRKINQITSLLLQTKPFITSDFPRKPREVQDISRWKATELRLFLIYLGPFILKNIISPDCFNNFMALNVAMIVLLSSDEGHYSEYAQQLLYYFVKTFDKIYGNFNISQNIHGLLHITTNFNHYGPLDQYSCFPFENHMKEIKKCLRKSDKPLQQFIRRYHEKCNVYNPGRQGIDEKYALKMLHNNGPLVENSNNPQYYQIFFENFTLKTNTDKDSYILTNCGQIIKCVNIAHNIQTLNSKVPVIVGKQFLNMLPAYTKPLCSTILNIYKINNLSCNLKIWNITDIKYKMMVIKFKDYTVAMPILHTNI